MEHLKVNPKHNETHNHTRITSSTAHPRSNCSLLMRLMLIRCGKSLKKPYVLLCLKNELPLKSDFHHIRKCKARQPLVIIALDQSWCVASVRSIRDHLCTGSIYDFFMKSFLALLFLFCRCWRLSYLSTRWCSFEDELRCKMYKRQHNWPTFTIHRMEQ